MLKLWRKDAGDEDQSSNRRITFLLHSNFFVGKHFHIFVEFLLWNRSVNFRTKPLCVIFRYIEHLNDLVGALKGNREIKFYGGHELLSFNILLEYNCRNIASLRSATELCAEGTENRSSLLRDRFFLSVYARVGSECDCTVLYRCAIPCRLCKEFFGPLPRTKVSIALLEQLLACFIG